MPAQIGSVFYGSVVMIGEVLREAHAVPVWVLSRTQESIRALEHRFPHLSAEYATALAVRNLFFGDADQFVLWEPSNLRHRLLRSGGWLETELPELNDQFLVFMGRRPLHAVARVGIDHKLLSLGYRLALQTWLRRFWLARSPRSRASPIRVTPISRPVSRRRSSVKCSAR